MATPFFADPFQLWRDAVSKLETEVNSLATGSTKSQDVVRALHQFSNVSLGMEQMVEKVIGGYLRRANLPSRRDVMDLAESLRRVEDKLDRLMPTETAALAPRPPRTKKPAQAAPAEAVSASPSAPATASAPAAANPPEAATATLPKQPARTRRPAKTTSAVQPAARAARRGTRRKGG